MHKIGLVPGKIAWVSIRSPLPVEVVRAKEYNSCEKSKATNAEHDTTQRIVVSTHPGMGTQYQRLQSNRIHLQQIRKHNKQSE